MARRKRHYKRVLTADPSRVRPYRRHAKHDDLQYRVSNSLLILVLGLMFIGYGAGQMAEQPTVGFQVFGGGEIIGGGGLPTSSDWPLYKGSVDRTGQGINGPDYNTTRFSYDTGMVQALTNPVVANGTVFFGGDGNVSGGIVYAVDQRTGALKWKFQSTGKPPFGITIPKIKSVAYYNGIVYATGEGGTIYFLDANAGTSKGAYNAGGTVYEPLVVMTTIYFSADDGKVYAVGTDGTLKWSVMPKVVGTDCWAASPVGYSGGNLYVGTEYCGAVSLDTNGNMVASSVQASTAYVPAVYDSAVYYGSTDNQKFYGRALDLSAKFSTDMLVAGSPSVSTDGKNAFVANIMAGMPLKYNISSVNTATSGETWGSIAWTRTIDTKPANAITVDTAKIYYATENGKVHAISVVDGSRIWSYSTGYVEKLSAPALGDNGIFVTTNHGKLHGIGPDKSAPAATDAGQSKDAPNYGETVSVFAKWTDNKGLASATLQVKEGSAAAVNRTTIELSGLSRWSNFTITAAGTSGTVVKWKIYATDTDGNMGAMDEKSFVVYENVPPSISSTGQSAKIAAGGTNTLTAEVSDNAALKEATLSTDETGTWTNWTGKYGSKAGLSGTSATVTFTWNNMAKGVGSKISWKVYVRDLSGNEAASGVKSFDIVSDVTPPSADYVGQWADQIAPGATNDLYAKWSDNAALARAELWVGESNVTSRKANEMLLSGRSMWSNFTYRPSGGDGTSVSWSVKAYDYSGIMAETALQSFTVLGDKIPPIISGLAQSSDWTEVGNTITLSADVTDNMALENAKLVIDDVVVQTTDLGGAKSAKASFDYMPPAIGTVRWNIIVQDTAGNSVKSDARTFTVSMKCAGTQPAPSQYGTCTNGEKKRVVYACDEKTGTWKATVETAACEEQFKELPIAYMLVGTVLVAIAVSSLLLYRKKYFRAAKPGKAEPGAVQW